MLYVKGLKEGLNGWADQVWLQVPDCLEDLAGAERLDWLEDQGWREELG